MNGMQTAAPAPSLSVAVLEPEAARNDLALVNPANIQLDESKLDKSVIATAENLLAQVKTFDPMNPGQVEFQDQAKLAVENLGLQTQREAAQMSNSPMLKKSIATLAKTEDGGVVAQTLIQLNNQVLELDPSGIDFSQEGGFKRLIGQVFGSKVQSYFSRYEKADALIAQIIQSLVNGREELKRDNMMLLESQRRMRTMTIQIEKAIMLGMYMDQKLDYMLNYELTDDEKRKKFVGEELIFPLRQRLLDLQQQLSVSQQGVLTFELIMRNNRELIKGVQRAEMVTVTALNIAVASALALGNQKLVLTTLGKLNETTNNIIAGTAERLKTQGVEIHKQASGAMLNIDTLKKAFGDIKAAIDDISTYRIQALGKMQENIAQMHELNTAASQAISRMEEGNRLAPSILLDVIAATEEKRNA
jgi:uncharacterized protein YaaN involved in tellurite resistance